MDLMAAVAVGLFLLVACTLGGWLIVRLGFTRDADAREADGLAPGPGGPAGAAPARPVPVDPRTDPNAHWREQMKAATRAAGADCACPEGEVPSPDCPVHRWDYA